MKFEHSLCSVKYYPNCRGEFDYKVTFLKGKRKLSGFEDGKKPIDLSIFDNLGLDGFEVISDYSDFEKEFFGVDDGNSKLSNNLSRTKCIINEIALCNKWDYFVTLTIDKNKLDRYNMPAYIKKLSKWINNYNSRNDCTLKYLFVPELHKDGAIHIHGLMSGIPQEHLSLFTLKDNIPNKLKKAIKDGEIIYNWLKYFDKFGYVTVQEIKDNVAISYYMLKYITKQPAVDTLGKHLYYCSTGLQRAVVIKKGHLALNSDNVDLSNMYSNDFVSIGWTSSPEDILNLIKY